MQPYPYQKVTQRRNPNALSSFRIWIPVVGGAIAMLLIVANMAYGRHGAVSTTSSTVPGTHDVQLSRLAVGDCLDGMRNDVTVSQMTTVPCNRPHDGEVIYQFELIGSWPGADEAETQAGDRCEQEIQNRLPNPDRFSTSYLYPNTKADWDANTTATCIARDRNHLELSASIGR